MNPRTAVPDNFNDEMRRLEMEHQDGAWRPAPLMDDIFLLLVCVAGVLGFVVCLMAWGLR